MRKKIDSKPFYGNDDNSKYIKTKIKTFQDSIITIFHDKKMSKEKIPCKCLSIIVLDSVIKTDIKYYAQTFLEECVYKQSESELELELESDSGSSDDETKSDIDNDE